MAVTTLSPETPKDTTSLRQYHNFPVNLGTALLSLVAVIGIALRLRQFLFNRSLWWDESAIALNIINRDLGSLLTSPLAQNQSAPPGFLLIVHGLVDVLGSDERVLRLVPLFAGALTVLIAVFVARVEFRSAAAKVTFVGLVALSPVLIFYASEMKQYSSDAFVALSILLAFSYRRARFGLWILAIVGFAGILFSLSAVFVLAPCGLLILFDAIRQSRWRELVVVSVAWTAGAALHGAYALWAGVDRAYMVNYWSKRAAFAPFPPDSYAEFLWYPRSFSGLTYLAFRELGPAGPGLQDGWFDPLGWTLVLVLLGALVAVMTRRQSTSAVAGGAILCVLLASALEIYPFSSRLLIFAIPLLFFIIAVGIDEINRLAGSATAALSAALLLSVMVPSDLETALRPRSNSDMRWALKQVERGLKQGDAVAVWLTGSVFSYYRHLLPRKTSYFKVRAKDPTTSLIDAAKKNNYRRVWFVLAHRPESAKKFIDVTGRRVPIEVDLGMNGTRVVLFDFGSAAP